MIIGVSGKAQSGKDTVSKMIMYTIWYYSCSQRLQPFSLEHYNNTYEKFGDVIDFTYWYKTICIIKITISTRLKILQFYRILKL